MRRRGRIPLSTYRLQLNVGFTFRQAMEVSEYLHELGISDCYASPILAARSGSTHGYDVCDWTRISPALGTLQDLERWSDGLRGLGMGLMLDIVPNHMGADLANPWWRDVLQRGETSPFASWFDIDWHSADERLAGKVLLPILEGPYCHVLESGKLRLVFDEKNFGVRYYERVLPLSPESLEWLNQEILQLCREEARSAESWEMLNALGEVAARLNALKTVWEGGQPSLPDPEEQMTATRTGPVLSQALDRFNGTVGQPESFDRLDCLLQRQHYRLAYWRSGNEQINYRRFFDVTDLVALRMELPEVFAATHRLVLRLVQQQRVTGLRVDHPDGLWDPRQYFQRLQQAAQDGISDAPELAGQPTHSGLGLLADEPPIYIVAEKILSPKEPLPQDWPVAGTTGYDFLNQLNGLFVNESHGQALDEIYREFTGCGPGLESLVYGAKLEILQTSMRSELEALARLLVSIAGRTRYGIDFSPSELAEALAAIIAGFPVYRTYLTESSDAPSAEVRGVIALAIQRARQNRQGETDEVLAFIEDLLLLRPQRDLDPQGVRAGRQFVMKFQQLTGPVMAKGLEDTAFYRYNRLLSLNEVGGAPNRFGTGLEEFHEQNRLRAQRWPHSLLATATHDTKRGEDLRARINVLSEMPQEWRQAVCKWSRLNSQKKTELATGPAPDANDEYLFYQTLVGAWVSEAETGEGGSAFRERLVQYLLKAVREAKVRTSWNQPNAAYEQATQRFVEEVLTPSQANPFLDDFMLFQRKVAFFGLFNSLAQVVLKITSPGVPDFYQGTELWDYSLVDPDNRRPVDFRSRRRLLTELRQGLTEAQADLPALIKLLLKNHQTGQIKLYLIWRALELRRRTREVFEDGAYEPLQALGSKAGHLCAFVRSASGRSVVTVAARLILGLTSGAQRGALEPDVWKDTTLPVPGAQPGQRYCNIFTGQILTCGPEPKGLAVPEVLGLLPVAVLERVD